jgi:SRSO17 transposase
MTEAQLARCRKRLEQFLVDLLEPLGRRERRHWGAVYVRGLLLEGERKSIEPMARRQSGLAGIALLGRTRAGRSRFS